jgi:KaiC/GvpD/RAD55 family RecA-like ATPase
MKLLKTGIAGLDEFLQGGLPPRVLLLPGTPGSGNEVFARQVAFTRANQGKITYFTVNETPEFVREDMASYGWDIAPLEASDNWRFKNLKKTSPFVEAVATEMEERRSIVVDSISELLLAHKIDELVNLLTTMSRQNRECQEYHLLLLTEGMHDQHAETTLQHFAEGVIIFTSNLVGDSTQRHVIIKKMKGTLVPTRRLPYSIGRRGFVIETAIRIS